MVQTLFLGFPAILWAKLFASAFTGILFTQSGLDKVFDYRGNLDYFRDHFKKSPLAPTVGLLMPVITFLETAAGLTSLVGVVLLLLGGNQLVAFVGLWLGAVALLGLFMGQRIAKDYAGAATLVPYFVAVLGGLVLYVVG
ncbi:MAG: DoxX family protein [Cytophagaceae bacterium]|nr:DoxX family protein [Cytophagaceae bacterium]